MTHSTPTNDPDIATWLIRRCREELAKPSRDEWGEAFMDLAKLIVEGFEISVIRAKLDESGIDYNEKDKDRSITLLELIINQGIEGSEKRTLDGLRTIQHIRSKVKGHASGREANTLALAALMKHESFSNHFKHVCSLVAFELQTIAEVIR